MDESAEEYDRDAPRIRKNQLEPELHRIRQCTAHNIAKQIKATKVNECLLTSFSSISFG